MDFAENKGRGLRGQSRFYSPGDEGLRVLVVDDDPETAETLAMLVRHLGHAAEVCHCGSECLACLESVRPDVVLLDISMPVTDGYEICRSIRRRGAARKSVIIACTALDRESPEDGFSLYLRKPVPLLVLRDALDRAREMLPVHQ